MTRERKTVSTANPRSPRSQAPRPTPNGLKERLLQDSCGHFRNALTWADVVLKLTPSQGKVVEGFFPQLDAMYRAGKVGLLIAQIYNPYRGETPEGYVACVQLLDYDEGTHLQRAAKRITKMRARREINGGPRRPLVTRGGRGR